MKFRLSELRNVIRRKLQEMFDGDFKGGEICPECGESLWSGHASNCSKYEKDDRKNESLSESACRKCGYDNPYMDDDPNYVCRQCKSRAEKFGDINGSCPDCSCEGEECPWEKCNTCGREPDPRGAGIDSQELERRQVDWYDLSDDMQKEWSGRGFHGKHADFWNDENGDYWGVDMDTGEEYVWDPPSGWVRPRNRGVRTILGPKIVP